MKESTAQAKNLLKKIESHYVQIVYAEESRDSVIELIANELELAWGQGFDDGKTAAFLEGIAKEAGLNMPMNPP